MDFTLSEDQLSLGKVAGQLFAKHPDDSIGAVVVTGRGRAFGGGADLSGGRFEASVNGSPDATLLRDRAGRLTLRIFESLKPIIAAINGPAVGVGATDQPDIFDAAYPRFPTEPIDSRYAPATPSSVGGE